MVGRRVGGRSSSGIGTGRRLASGGRGCDGVEGASMSETQIVGNKMEVIVVGEAATGVEWPIES